MNAIPGNPFQTERSTAEQEEILKEKYGLNDPKPVQYLRYMSNIFSIEDGKLDIDLGESLKKPGVDVADTIFENPSICISVSIPNV